MILVHFIRSSLAQAVCIAACSVLILPAVQAQTSDDSVILQMAEAARRKDSGTLSQLLPAAQDHVLGPWAAYWELAARLETAASAEIEQFLQKYQGSYQEDRLRNDWLLLLGKQRDWPSFAKAYPSYRMQDDHEVRCYSTLALGLPQAYAPRVLQSWQALGNASDACSLATHAYVNKGLIAPNALWPLARYMAERGRAKAVEQVVEIAAPGWGSQVMRMNSNPQLFLSQAEDGSQGAAGELQGLALIRIAAGNADTAAQWLTERLADTALAPATRSAVWGVIGKQATLDHSFSAWTYAAHAKDSELTDDLLGWKVRAALRAGQWSGVLASIDAMSAETKEQSIWQYWRGRALSALGQNTAAQNAFKRATAPRRSSAEMASGEDDSAIPSRGAGIDDYYAQLAFERLGLALPVPAPPAPPTHAELQTIQQNPGFVRALTAMRMGLRNNGLREWNYETNLHAVGGLSDRLRLAAAQIAEDHALWDRSINTSERTRELFHMQQRYPTPLRSAIEHNSKAWNLDPALVYGLIRQESRFISFARSAVGASGLMQVMKATARNVARRLGISAYSDKQISDAQTNLQLGTGYLRLVLDDFDGSVPMALAAYNAGPGRPRKWRENANVNADVWVETIPFTETRDYVKKVLSNAVLYNAVLHGKPGSITAYLGKPIGPRTDPSADPSAAN